MSQTPNTHYGLFTKSKRSKTQLRKEIDAFVISSRFSFRDTFSVLAKNSTRMFAMFATKVAQKIVLVNQGYRVILVKRGSASCYVSKAWFTPGSCSHLRC